MGFNLNNNCRKPNESWWGLLGYFWENSFIAILYDPVSQWTKN